MDNLKSHSVHLWLNASSSWHITAEMQLKRSEQFFIPKMELLWMYKFTICTMSCNLYLWTSNLYQAYKLRIPYLSLNEGKKPWWRSSSMLFLRSDHLWHFGREEPISNPVRAVIKKPVSSRQKTECEGSRSRFCYNSSNCFFGKEGSWSRIWVVWKHGPLQQVVFVGLEYLQWARNISQNVDWFWSKTSHYPSRN